jgi:hypothetical protein
MTCLKSRVLSKLRGDLVDGQQVTEIPVFEERRCAAWLINDGITSGLATTRSEHTLPTCYGARSV